MKAASTALTSGGLKFGANANADTAATSAVVTNALGSTVNVVGTEAVSEHTYSTDNITTEISQDTDGNSTITVKFDENPSFSSVTVGDTTVGDGTVTLGSTASLSATGLTVGNTSVTDTGLAISDGPSVTSTGIDAGSKKITRVLTGVEDTDAVNVGQLNAATSGIKGITRSGDATDGYTTTIEGKLSVSSNGAFSISGDISGDKFTVDSDGAISAAGGKFSVNSSGSLTIGSETQNTSVSDAGLTITDGPSVTTSGIDAGGKKITNVLKGEADTDAVNVKQLSDALLTYSSTGALDTGKGMTINSAKLEVNAGEGLTFDTEENGYKLKVNAGEGLTIDPAKENALKVNAGGGLTTDNGALKVNAGEGLTIDTEENGYKLKVDKSAISGTIAENNTGFVTGGDVHSALALKADASSVYTKEETDTKLTAKANAATTLEGYGITDAYTIDTADAKFATLTGATLSNATLTDATISSGSIAEGVTIGTGDSAITVGSLKSSVATNANNINTLTTTVSGHTASISALDATVNDADTGLVKKVGDNTASIGENAFNISSLQATVGNHTEAIGTINSSITDINTSITALDTNKANVGLDNVTDAGKSVVRGLAKESVKVVTGTYTTVDKGIDGNADAYTVNVTADGVVDSNNTGLVTGGAVYSALQAFKPDGKVEEGNAKAVSGGTVYSAIETAKTDVNAETDTKIATAKTDITSDMDTKLASKANASDVYTKAETYSQAEVDATLADYVKTEGATLTGATLTNATLSNAAIGSGSIADTVMLGDSISVGALKSSVSENTSAISSLKSTVGDDNSGLVQKVNTNESSIKTLQDKTQNMTATEGVTTIDGTLSAGATTVSSMTDGTATLSGGALTGVTTITASGAISGGSLNVGTGAISGGMATVTGLTVGETNVTTALTTEGAVAANNAGFVSGGAVYSALQAFKPDGKVEEGDTKAVSGDTVYKVTSGLDARIKTNADAIATKADASTVTELSGKVTANEAAIKTNADNITTLTGKVTANETAIKANTDNITTLSGKVTANETAIKTNADNITTLTGKVTANETAIKTNADNITTLTGKVTANETAIETNATNIAANKTAIETNATNIAANKTAIEKNAGDITALGKKVTANETVLAQKADKANTLKGYGIEDAYTKEDSDTLLNKKADKTEFEAVKVVVGDANSGLVKDVNDLKNASQKITTDDQGNTKVDGTLVVEETIVVQGKDVTENLSTDGKVEDNNHGYVDGDKVYDYLNKGKDGDGKVKLATESKQIAMGQGSEAGGSESIAIGNAAGGQNNEASGTQSIAIGFGNKVTGDHSGAIGDPSVINGTNSYSVGNSNTVAAGSNNVFVLGNNVNVTGSNTVVLGGSSDGSTMNVAGSNSVVLGAGSDGSEDNVVSVGAAGNERRITHVAPGETATDAATVGQVQDIAQGAYNNAVYLNNRINKVDTRLNKVGAGAAALAALHPLDTDDKFTMGLGYGNYRSANAMAMGMFYRPTDKMMISVGGAFGNGENMINAGISFALDKNKGFNTSKALMARNIKALSAENAAIKEENADMKKQLNAQDAKLTTQEAEIQALKAALARLEAKIGK